MEGSACDAKVITPPRDVAGINRVTVLEAPTGGMFGVIARRLLSTLVTSKKVTTSTLANGDDRVIAMTAGRDIRREVAAAFARTVRP